MFPLVRTKVFSLGTLGVVGNVYRVPEHERFEQSAATHKQTCRHVSHSHTCRHVSRGRGAHLLGPGLAVSRWQARTPPPPRADTWLAAVGKSPPVTILSRVSRPVTVTRHTWPVDAARLVPQHLHHAGHAELAAPAVTIVSRVTAQRCHAAQQCSGTQLRCS